MSLARTSLFLAAQLPLTFTCFNKTSGGLTEGPHSELVELFAFKFGRHLDACQGPSVGLGE